MKTEDGILPAEATKILRLLQHCLGPSLVAAYLHGSAVAGGLTVRSDIDILAIVNTAPALPVRKCLLAQLMSISGHPIRQSSSRPLEVIILLLRDLSPLPYPARVEFIYGEWRREDFEAGEIPEPESDPELTVLLAQARQNSAVLFGPDAVDLLPIVSRAELNRAFADMLPSLLQNLEGDERNVLLTLARMWHTISTGELVSKDAAADWAAPRLSAESNAILDFATQAYLGVVHDDWSSRRQLARRSGAELARNISTALTEFA